jgi:hypothetical protein
VQLDNLEFALQTIFMTQTNSPHNIRLEHVDRLKRLTRAYARFAENAAGLGNVLGGVLAITMWLTANAVELSLWSRLLFAAFPIVWVIAKETLRQRYYLRHGLARETPNTSERNWHIAKTAFTTLVSVYVIRVVGSRTMSGTPVTWETLGYLAFVSSLPVFVWFTMRTTEEYLVGVLLFVQAALFLAGSYYEISWQNAYFPLFALIAITMGFKQHHDYRKLERDLDALRQQT